MKKVPYDPKLPTIPAGQRQVAKPLSQKQLDAIIRKVKGDHAIEELVHDGQYSQVYMLDDGRHLYINKYSGKTRTLQAHG